MSINWQDELNHEWHSPEQVDDMIDRADDLLEDFVAHQSPLSAGDEGYMATTGAISKETPTPGEPPSTPEPRHDASLTRCPCHYCDYVRGALATRNSCPWCQSTDKAVVLEPGCYNDWHFPLCKNCGKGKYSHGHAWGCQRYEAEQR